MKNIVFTLSFLFFSLTKTIAQIQAGAVLGLGIPVGDFANGFNMGMGFGGTGKYFFKDNMAAGLNIHYFFFSDDGYYDDAHNEWDSKMNVVPITGLFQYFFTTESPRIYAGGDFMLYNYTYKWEHTWTHPVWGYAYDKGSSSDTEVGMAPAFGAEIKLTDKFVLDAGMKLHLMLSEENLNYISFNFGFFYKFDK